MWETRVLVLQMAVKIQLSHSLIDPQGISNSLFGVQRMTSDCEDVRRLMQALAAKIELSWKLLSGQHLANCMFGLQGLSSAEPEVRALLHALVPKILACRDELSAEQICHALFGLQNLSSEHEEVLPLVGALTEKLTLCTETISVRHLASAMYGLQGMEISSLEMKQMISAVGIKLAAADEIDAASLGNCLYGLQVSIQHPLWALYILFFSSAPSQLCTLLISPVCYPYYRVICDAPRPSIYLVSHIYANKFSSHDIVHPTNFYSKSHLLYDPFFPCRELTTHLRKYAHS